MTKPLNGQKGDEKSKFEITFGISDRVKVQESLADLNIAQPPPLLSVSAPGREPVVPGSSYSPGLFIRLTAGSLSGYASSPFLSKC